jgi:hypothetical protein
LCDHVAPMKLPVGILCAVASVRVLIFIFAFPFFTNVDEEAHFDLVVKYAHGRVPNGLDKMAPEAARYVAYYRSPEYFMSAADFPEGQLPAPPWLTPVERLRGPMTEYYRQWESYDNHESAEPPLYYTLAGTWMNAGSLAGLHGSTLLYWTRLMNVPLAALLVWLAFVAARMVFPDDRFMQLAAPALVALMPQSAWYQVSNDVLSPVCYALVFVCVLRLWQVERPSLGLAASSGLAVAASWLTKTTSNVPLLLVAAVMIALRAYTLAKEGKGRRIAPAYALLFASAAVPIAAWVAWSIAHWGDATGGAAKIKYLGWTVKPVALWLRHPLFTPGGAWEFSSGTIASFWRGEFVWGLDRMAFPATDFLYVISSVVFVGAATVGLVRVQLATATRRALWFALASFVAAIGNLAFLSLIFDFHECVYPSAEHPYFTSGRLATGAMVPFVLVYAWGVAHLTRRVVAERGRLAILAAILAVMLVSQIASNRIAFSSRYNWAHTPSSATPP